MRFEEKKFPMLIQGWWEEIKVEGWVGHRLATKFKVLKNKITEWAKLNFGDVQVQKSNILTEIQALDKKEESGQLSLEGKKRNDLKEEFQRKLTEEIKWRQRSRCKCQKESDKNTRFFLGMASSRRRANILSHYGWAKKAREERGDYSSH